LQPGQVTKVCCDMSPAFIRGVADQLPNAEITFDRYHVIAALNTAMDDVRKAERRTAPELARSKYLWLKRPERLNERQAETLAWLTRPSSQLATARAYRWRWDFDGHLRSSDFFDVETNPTMTFRSTGVRQDGDNYLLDGDLTIRGISRPITLAVEFGGFGPDPYGGTRAGFKQD